MFFHVPYIIHHFFICRPSDSTVSEDAGIDLRTVATLALAVRCYNHSAESHSHSAKSHPHPFSFEKPEQLDWSLRQYIGGIGKANEVLQIFWVPLASPIPKEYSMCQYIGPDIIERNILALPLPIYCQRNCLLILIDWVEIGNFFFRKRSCWNDRVPQLSRSQTNSQP